MTIWDDANVDWGSGEGLRATQLFERAYSDARQAREVANDVGLRWPPTAPDSSHSELWTALLTGAASDGRQLDIAAELLGDPGRSVFATPLRRLLGTQLGAANAKRISYHGLPSSEAERTAVIESLDPASTASAILPNGGGLESINIPGAGIQPITAALQVLLNARHRVALVRAGLVAVGTGFLVGPDLLLTAAHVLNRTQEPDATDIERLDVVLDFSGVDRTVAETGSAVPVIELIRASAATEEELRGGQLTASDAPLDRLDYALLRLGRRVGDDPTQDTSTRGWYRMETTEPNLTDSTSVTIFHFPLGSFLSTSLLQGPVTYKGTTTKTRLRYRTNTLPGSSGAPMIDESGRLLGVHHYGEPNANQAVPIWRIAQAIADLLPIPGYVSPAGIALADPPGGPSANTTTQPNEVLQVGPRPVVNRAPLRTKLWSAMTQDDTTKCLVITGSTESGVSWSWHLLSYLASQSLRSGEVRALAPQGVQAICVDLRKHITRTPAERRAELVHVISKRIAGDVSDESVSQWARQVSEFKEWCYQRLIGAEKQWWIFIDSIDEPGDVEMHGIGEVLAALVDLSDDPQVGLRIVLAGRGANMLSHQALDWAATDTPVGLTRDEVKTWLEERVTQTGRTAQSQRVDDFLARWFGASTRADRPVELTLALPQAVEDVSV